MLTAAFTDFELQFKKPARTSRGVMTSKRGYLLNICRDQDSTNCGVGECSPLVGLSCDDKPEYREALKEVCRNINLPLSELLSRYTDLPSIMFGVESALLDLANGGRGILFKSDFTRGLQPIPINGLIWMGSYDSMLSQIKEKLTDGFKVIKIKVGAIDFDAEIGLLKHIRKQFSADEITIRLDANGAFDPDTALQKLEMLAKYDIHSIEQPIRAGNPEKMRFICSNSPIPIALDEELIGVNSDMQRLQLLTEIKPQYIILKPSLVGGFTICNRWIDLCRETNTGFWITSALESNIGLNAIAQYTATLDTADMAQGLGTGGLFTNNFPSGLVVRRGHLYFE
jgi:o-succinylbenzoate synthase